MRKSQTTALLQALQAVLLEREATARSRNDQLVLQFGIEIEKLNRRRDRALRDRLAALEQRLALLETRS